METAAPKGQFRADKNWFFIRLLISIILLPPIKSGIKKYPRVGTNTSILPDIIPDLVKGKVILKNDLNGEAPKSEEASSSEKSNFSMEEYSGSTMKGNIIYTIPTSTEPSV